MTREITNATSLRYANVMAVVEELKKCDSASNADLARLTGLSLATCVNITAELLDQGEVVQLDEKKSSGGRPARRFRYNPDNSAFLFLLIKPDTAGELIRSTVVNAAGAPLLSREDAFPTIKPKTVIDHVASIEGDFPKLKGVSISIPGVATGGKIELSDVPGIIGADLEEMVATRFGVGVAVDNDMNYAALGYHHRLKDKNIETLAYLAFPRDHCPGSGIVVNGRLIRGKSSFAGEISYIPVDKARDPVKKTKAGRIDYMARLVAGLTAVLNPDVIGIWGDLVDEDLVDDVLTASQKYVDRKHLPILTYEEDYVADSMLGMLVSAMACSQ